MKSIVSGGELGWSDLKRAASTQLQTTYQSKMDLGSKKERIWVSSNEVDETGAYHIEWSQSERGTPTSKPIHQYKHQCIYMEFKKTVMTTLYVRQQRDTDVKNRPLHYVGEGEDGMVWENSIETCILPSVKQMTSTSVMHEAGHSKMVLWDNPEGWGGREVGGGFRMGNTYVPMTDSCQCMAKTTTIL